MHNFEQSTTFVFTSGSSGGDVLNGTSGVDSLSGGAGDDTITDFGGNDFFDGGDANDTIQIVGGSDTQLLARLDQRIDDFRHALRVAQS